MATEKRQATRSKPKSLSNKQPFQIRVEIYGALDRETGHFRLRAAPPRVVESQKQRFLNILISLSQLVHPDSLLVVDSSVDRSIFMTLGFRNVIDPNANSTMGTNEKIMNLLKTNVPNMFQVCPV